MSIGDNVDFRDLDISVVIRNRNEATTLAHVLSALTCQARPAAEIIIVDNDSTDNSLRAAEKHHAKIVSIGRDEFTYGRAINKGIQAASGEVILLLSAHSIPAGREFLAQVAAAFSDPRVAGARLLQASRAADCMGWPARPVLEWPMDDEIVFTWGLNAAGCALRRSVWERIPFDESIECAEDKLWTLEALKRGYRIVCAPAPYCYVKRGKALDAVARSAREGLAVYRITGRLPNTSLAGMMKDICLVGPKIALLHALCSLKRYCLYKSIPRVAKRATPPGALQ